MLGNTMNFMKAILSVLFIFLQIHENREFATNQMRKDMFFLKTSSLRAIHFVTKGIQEIVMLYFLIVYTKS